MPASFISYIKTMLASLAALTITITPAGPPANTAQVQSTTNITSGTSRNWSGYETTGGTFTKISGTWTIPNATGSGHTTMDATWVGIGGIKNNDLIQSGTQNIVSPAGLVTTTAFFELLPSASQTLPVTVKVGDSVSVAITQQTTSQWLINFNNNTTGQNYQTTVTYNSSLSSAEWVEESPSTGRTIVPLDNFGTLQFSAGSTTQNGNNVSIASSYAQAITMVNNKQQTLASPSALGSDGASFSITRSTNPATSPSPTLDREPSGWRRRGMDIGGFTIPHIVRRWQYVLPSITFIPSQQEPTENPSLTNKELTNTPEPTQTQESLVGSQSAFIHRSFQFHTFGFRRHF